MPRVKRSSRRAHMADDTSKTVKALYESGQSVGAIAENTGLTTAQINKIIKANGANAGVTDGGPSTSKKDVPKMEFALTDLEESVVFRLLQFLEPICWEWKFRMFKHMITKLAADAGITHQFPHAWRAEFLARHESDLSERIVTAFSLTPSKTIGTLVKKEDFFKTLKELYRRLQIEHKPDRIWNFGASEVLLPEPPKRPTKKSGDNKPKEEHVSAMHAVSASGECSPATLLFKGARIALDWKCLLSKDDQEMLHLMVNDSGFCDNASSVKWLKNFVRWVDQRPIVLFCDSSIVHPDNYDFIKLAYESQIHLVTIPKKLHSVLKLPFTHTIAPRVKDKWYEELDETQLIIAPTSPVVQSFAPAHRLLNEFTVKESFRVCGIYPLDPTVEHRNRAPVNASEKPEDVDEMPPLSPATQEAVNMALEAFTRAGVSEVRAMRLLKNMNVPGFAVT